MNKLDPIIIGFLSIIVVSFASLIGILTIHVSSKYLPELYNILIAYATGVLLAVVLYDLFPETVEIYGGFTPSLSTIVIAGLMFPFLLEKTVHWHHHHALDHQPYCDELLDEENIEKHIKPFVWVNLLGDGLHNFVDGAVLITTFSISTGLGIVTFLGILVHELAQELGDFSILVEGGLSIKKALFFNFLTALTALLGGIIAFFIRPNLMEKLILPFAAGNFLYLAIADLIPELNKKIRRIDWIIQIFVGTIGVLTMYSLTLLG